MKIEKHHPNSRQFRCRCGKKLTWKRADVGGDAFFVQCPCGVIHARGDRGELELLEVGVKRPVRGAPRSALPTFPVPEDRREGAHRLGGHLADIPTPHIRRFDGSSEEREVRFSITSFVTIGALGARHYYAKAEEESNPIWDASEGCWTEAWDDKGAQGRKLSIDTLSPRAAWRAIKRLRKYLFPNHRYVDAVCFDELPLELFERDDVPREIWDP